MTEEATTYIHMTKEAITYKVRFSKLPQEHKQSSIILAKNDSLTTAGVVKKYNSDSKILVLNFANNDAFCDKKFLGSTQEEDIVRRTNLSEAMPNNLYPISDPYENPTFLLSENIQVLEDKDNMPIDPFTVDIISSAALKCPRYIVENYDCDRHDYKYEEDKIAMTKKIENIVATATHYDAFITGAWGMGQFCNPYYGLIKIWNEVLGKYKVPLTFFVIPDDETRQYFHKFLECDRPHGVPFGKGT